MERATRGGKSGTRAGTAVLLSNSKRTEKWAILHKSMSFAVLRQWSSLVEAKDLILEQIRHAISFMQPDFHAFAF